MTLSDKELFAAAEARGLLREFSLSQLQRLARRHRLRLLEAAAVDQRIPLSAFYRAWAEQHDWPFIDWETAEPQLDALPPNLLRLTS